jgi:V/A-type H+-transporting ATPase subunit D
MRVRALPTIKNKESALRMEVKRAKDDILKLEQELEQRITAYDKMLALWGEFDTTLLQVEDVKMSIKKIAGVRIPLLDEVVYKTKPFSLFNSPKWFADGLTQLKELAQVGIEQEFSAQKLHLLEYARKKTTQKVNLFEKVQIPGYDDAIRKIKRFMEDEENLSKSSQKIVKSRQEKLKEAEL